MLTPHPHSSRSSDPLPSGNEAHLQPPDLDESSLGHSPFLQVRPARQPDIGALADVLASSFHQQSGWMAWLYPVLRLGIYEDLRSRLRSPNQPYVCLVAVDRRPANPASGSPERDRIVGTVEMSLRNNYLWRSRSSQELYISNLAVQTPYRRQGVGQKLLQVCEQVAQDWEFQTLSLHVLETNQQARGLYHKLGYQCCSVETGLKTWILAQPRRFLMKKSLLALDAMVASAVPPQI